MQFYFANYRGKLIDEETFRIHFVNTGAHYIKTQLRYKEEDQKKQIEFAYNLLFILKKEYFTKILFLDEIAVATSARNG